MTSSQLQKAQALWQEIEALEDSIYGFENFNSDLPINNFIKNWCGENTGHLLDIDENEGQDLRVRVYLNLLREKAKVHAETCSNWLDWIYSDKVILDNEKLSEVFYEKKEDLSSTLSFYKEKGVLT